MSPVTPTVTLSLLVAINDGPPIELGTGDVHPGDTRDQLAALLRQAADEIDSGVAFRPRHVLGIGPRHVLGQADEGGELASSPVDHDRDRPPDP